MAGRRLFVPGERLTGTRLTLTGDEHRHVGRVLRARVGDRLTLFDGAGGEVEGRVARVERGEIELELGARRMVAGPATPLTLLVAVPRGARMDFLVEKTVELGVARIIPVIAERSVVRLDAEANRGARWEKIAREAARQCGRADVPVIAAPAPLGAALVDGALPARRLALFEGEKTRSLGAELAGAGPVATALLVGPEGGFGAAEIAAARDAGFTSVGLGPRILRVETAAIAGLALLAGAYGLLD
jgi:16S rRNA (uracil1498-N3)-methyltransferase